jgi:hypothetical protein
MSMADQVRGQGLTFGAVLVGGIILAGGLIFLCAATQDAARLPVAVVLLVIGGGLAGWAGIRWRRARQLTPDVIGQRITDLADASDGEVTLSQVVSTLDVPVRFARPALARLEALGLCRIEQREAKTVYNFPGLKESKVVRRCTYCGSESSVREPSHKCPNCGGTLEIVKT